MRTTSTARRSLVLTAALTAALVPALTACGGDPADPAPQTAAGATEGAARVVSAPEAAAILADPPAGLVVLDVRTPGEYAAGHVAGAQLVDFSAPDFAEKVGALDRGTPYLVYCRSGNRSGQAVAAMAQLGFTDLTDMDGGTVAWTAAGLPLVTG